MKNNLKRISRLHKLKLLFFKNSDRLISYQASESRSENKSCINKDGDWTPENSDNTESASIGYLEDELDALVDEYNEGMDRLFKLFFSHLLGRVNDYPNLDNVLEYFGIESEDVLYFIDTIKENPNLVVEWYTGNCSSYLNTKLHPNTKSLANFVKRVQQAKQAVLKYKELYMPLGFLENSTKLSNIKVLLGNKSGTKVFPELQSQLDDLAVREMLTKDNYAWFLRLQEGFKRVLENTEDIVSDDSIEAVSTGDTVDVDSTSLISHKDLWDAALRGEEDEE